MARFHLQTLGELSLREGGPEGEVLVGGSKGLAVLAYLAATPDHGAARDYLADLLWPSRDHSASRQCLRQALYYVRQKAGGRLTVTEDGVLRLLDERLSADLWAVEAALDAERWEDAVALDRGPFLGEFRADSREFRHWADSRRDGLEAGLRLAYGRLVDAWLARDEPEAAAEVARRWRDRDPLDEEAVKALIRALTAAGDGAAAHRAFEAYRGLLRRELDDEPGEELARRAAGLRSLLEEGPPEGEEPAGEAGSGRASRASVWRAAAGLALAVLVAAGLLVGWGLTAREPPEGGGSLEAAEDRAPVWIAWPWRASGPGAYRVSPGDGGLSVDPVAERPPPLPSPDGRWIARGEAREDGWDLVVTDASGGEARRAMIRAPGDEHPLAWSPDGRRLLYVDGRPSGGSYRRSLRVARVPGGSIRPFFAEREFERVEGADWSPDGLRVAVAAGEGRELDVWVADADGRGARRVAAAPGEDLRPAWSPDGDRLAFVSRRNGNADVYVARLADGSVRRVTRTPDAEEHVRWLDAGRLAVVRWTGGHESEIWSVPLDGEGEARLLGRLPRPQQLRPAGPRPERWIHEVAVEGVPGRLAPGQIVRPGARARTVDGRTLAGPDARIRWSTSDSAVLRLRADGWLEAAAPGRALLRASAAGWRADSVAISVEPAEVGEPPVLLEEDWTGGIDPGRWLAYGSPRPGVVRPEGDRFPAALRSNGDDHYKSGVVSRATFPLEDGLTVELWGRVPVNGPHYQDLDVGLATGPLPDPDDEASRVRNSVFLRLGPGGRDRPWFLLLYGGRALQAEIPAPGAVDRWRRYALQLHPTGRVDLVVDGRLYWRSPAAPDLPEAGRVRVALEGNTLDTDVLHGPVTVYRGLRYHHGEDPPERD